MATSAEWHEDYNKMSEASRNFSRAIKSVREELEAVDWYNQRAEQTSDEQLKKFSNTTVTKKSSTPSWHSNGCVGTIRNLTST